MGRGGGEEGGNGGEDVVEWEEGEEKVKSAYGKTSSATTLGTNRQKYLSLIHI